MQPWVDKFFSEAQRQNFERGRNEGKAEGQGAALLTILTRRGLALGAEQRRQIVECTDLGQLEQWLERSLSVRSVDELLAK
jgi:hypothetical protein